MKKSMYLIVSLLVAMSMILAACQTAATEAPAVEEPAVEEPAVEEPAAAGNPGLQMESATVAPQFWSEEEYNKEKELMSASPLNPDAPFTCNTLWIVLRTSANILNMPISLRRNPHTMSASPMLALTIPGV